MRVATGAVCSPSITKPAKSPGNTTTRQGVARLGCSPLPGMLLFTGDGSGHLLAFDAAKGKILWHAGLADDLSNGPETYLLDGQQYVVAGAGDSLYAFTLEP